MNTRRATILGLVLLLIVACGLYEPALPTTAAATSTPTMGATSEPPTNLPASAMPPSTGGPTAPSLPSGSGPCQASSQASVNLYMRPSPSADVFTSMVLTDPLEITSRSADGWLGFEPGKAQAANMGVFRLRWIAPDAAVTLSGDCSGVPTAAWVPAPGICYEMVQESVDVHASANANSPISGTLKAGDFAAILGQTASGWLSVNGDQATAPGATGFIPQSEMNVDGPCDSIPTVPG